MGFFHAVLDTAVQVFVIGSRFVDKFLPTLQFWGVLTLNGIKADSTLSTSQSNDVQVTLGNINFPWKFLKADISDDCILGLDFIANFELDIRLSENTVTVVGRGLGRPLEHPLCKYTSLYFLKA